MVSGPHAVSIAKRRAQQLDDLGKIPPPARGSSNCSKKERPKVSSHPCMPISSGVGRGTSMMDLTAKPPCSSSRRYSATEGKNHGATLSGSPPCERTDRAHGGGDGRHIAVTAELADEAAARAKRAVDAGDHELGPAHPVERRIGEHRVELILEGKRMAVDLLHLEALGGGSGEQLLAQIGAKHIGAAARRSLRVSTPSPQPRSRMRSPFARRQQVEHGTGKLRDETAFHGIVVGRQRCTGFGGSFRRRSFRRSRLPRLVVARRSPSRRPD